MRLLIDMNLTPLWVPFFAEQGFESVHWSSIGNLPRQTRTSWITRALTA